MFRSEACSTWSCSSTQTQTVGFQRESSRTLMSWVEILIRFLLSWFAFPFPSLLFFLSFLSPIQMVGYEKETIRKIYPSFEISWSTIAIGTKSQFWASSTAGSSPVYQLCEAGLWGVLYANQKICRRHYPTRAWEQVRYEIRRRKSKQAADVLILLMIVMGDIYL